MKTLVFNTALSEKRIGEEICIAINYFSALVIYFTMNQIEYSRPESYKFLSSMSRIF